MPTSISAVKAKTRPTPPAPDLRDAMATRNTLIFRLWGEGRTSQQVADEAGCSRSAVLGLIRRAGLSDDCRLTPGVVGRAKPTPDAPVEAGRGAPQAIKARPAPAPAPAVAKAPPVVDQPPAAKKPAPATAVKAIAPTIAAFAAAKSARLFDEFPVAQALGALASGECRFPLGDPRVPGFRYCCERVVKEGKTYCGEHHVIAYAGSAARLVPSSRTGALNGLAR